MNRPREEPLSPRTPHTREPPRSHNSSSSFEWQVTQLLWLLYLLQHLSGNSSQPSPFLDATGVSRKWNVLNFPLIYEKKIYYRNLNSSLNCHQLVVLLHNRNSWESQSTFCVNFSNGRNVSVCSQQHHDLHSLF